MKKNALVMTFALSALNSPASASQPPLTSIKVATCGGYSLHQDLEKSYFAGILHAQNTYRIIDPSGHDERAAIETNSEGAQLIASHPRIVDPKTGAIEASEKWEIVAMWGEFTLTITEPNGHQKQFKCHRNEASLGRSALWNGQPGDEQ